MKLRASDIDAACLPARTSGGATAHRCGCEAVWTSNYCRTYQSRCSSIVDVSITCSCRALCSQAQHCHAPSMHRPERGLDR
eukprot:scaffold144262_cov18-Prasinocladus_malaysianus.AAC.1